MKTGIERSKVLHAIGLFFNINSDDTWQGQLRRQASIIELCKEMGQLGLMLAGGAVNSIFTNGTINDLDFYMRRNDDVSVLACETFFRKHFPEVPYKTENALSFARNGVGRKVWRAQLITRFIGTPEFVLDSFDFTITQGLFDFENDSFVLGERFLPDIAKRRLVYCGKSHFPICAMYRTLKYQARGYTLPGSTVMHIALSIVRLDIKTYKDLKYQLMGIDTMYLQGLLNGPKYADNLPVDYGQFLVDAFTTFDGEEHDVAEFSSDAFQETWVTPIVTAFKAIDGNEGTVGDV